MLQNSVRAQVVYKAETTFGTAASAAAAQIIRRTSSNLSPNKDGFASNEVRSDGQVSDFRHGARSARGSVEGELSTVTYDDWFEAAMRGTWAAGVSCSPTDFATGVTPNGTTGVFTFAGAGSLLTKGFKIGDTVAFTGMTANNGINFRITALTGTVMTVTPKPTTSAQVATGWTCAVRGKKLIMGVTTPSFTIEHMYPDIDLSELFTGCRIGGFSLSAPPNGAATVQFDILGQNAQTLTGAASPHFTSPSTETTTSILTGIDGALRLSGVERGVVTSLQINHTSNLSAAPVIGSTVSPDILYGRSVVTGNVSAYLEDSSLIDAFLNESNIDIVGVMSGSGITLPDFLSFSMQNVKFTGLSKSVGADGGIIAQFPFQAILKAGGTGTAYDQSTLVIQRSN